MVQLRNASRSNPYKLQEKSSMIRCLSTFLSTKWITAVKRAHTEITRESLQLSESSLLHGAGACAPVMFRKGLPALLDKLLLIPHFGYHLLCALPLTFCVPPSKWVFLFFVLHQDLYKPLSHLSHYLRCIFIYLFSFKIGALCR